MNFLKNQFKKVSENTGTFLESAGKSIKETTSKTIDAASLGIKKSTKVITKTYHDKKAEFLLHHPSACRDFLTEVDENLFHMIYPEDELLPKYSKLLNIEYGGRYRIWNVSEHSYKIDIFNDQVFEYVQVGYPNPPLMDLFLICKEIASWLDAEKSNIAIVHCQKGSIRSCLVFGCLQFIRGQTSNPSENIPTIAQRIGLAEETNNFAMNSQYSKYMNLLFSQFPVDIHNWQLKTNKVKIKSVYINKLPKVQLYSEHKDDPVLNLFQGQIRPYLQVFKDNSLIFNSMEKIKKFVVQSEGSEVEFVVNTVFEGDVLFRVRHFLTSDFRYPILRFMINTAFLSEQELVLNKYNMDFGRDVEAGQDLIVRVTYESVEEHSEYSDILARTRLKEKFTHRARNALKIKESIIEEGGDSQGKEDAGPKSPAFVIADSPHLKSKGSSEKGSNSDITSAGKRIEVKTGGVFFANSVYKELPTPTSFGTIESNEEGEEGEDDQEGDVNMEDYLKSLETK